MGDNLQGNFESTNMPLFMLLAYSRYLFCGVFDRHLGYIVSIRSSFNLHIEVIAFELFKKTLKITATVNI